MGSLCLCVYVCVLRLHARAFVFVSEHSGGSSRQFRPVLLAPPGDRDINLARISSSRIKVTRTHVLSLHRCVYTYIHPCTLVICTPCHISYATIRGGPPKAKPYCSLGNRFQLFDLLSKPNLKFLQDQLSFPLV